MRDLARYFRELGKNELKGLVLGHPHADPDAVSSVMALGEILESLGVKVTTGIPRTLSRTAESVLKTLDKDIQIDPPFNPDFVVVLDTSTLDQLEDYYERIESSDSEIIFIDHHRPDEEMDKKIKWYFVDEDSTSAVELVLKLGKILNHKFSQETSTLMFTGVLSDTGHFKFANEGTFRAVVDLIDYGADYRLALEALETPVDPSKKVAMLKAAQRSELHKYHGKWVVFSELGAYESDAANMFIRIGADVGIIASDNGDGIRLSSRSRSGLAAETNLHLGELMSNVAEYFGGVGGGHAGAAGMKVEADIGDVKEKVLKEIEKMLEPKEG